jgi:4-hydroxysphinganine ceramide fatty acyl 2-hydroxylase
LYKGKILNVTSFLSAHPGGESSMIPYLGKDISEVFESSGHSEYAESLIPTLYLTGATEKTDMIDPYKGTFYQVWKMMNLKSYTEFVNSPKLIKGHMRVFDSPLLEPLSKTPWQLIPIIWLPVISYWLMVGLSEGGPESLLWFFIGLGYWTLFEYLLHRFCFHSESYLPDNRYVICIHYLLHGIHHAYPMDSLRLVFPPVLGFLLCTIFKSLYNLYLPFAFSNAFMAGKILGYVYYDLFHYFSHHQELKEGYTGFMKKYHLAHHYKNSNQGFGVSNHFWDVVFGTRLSLD